MVCIKSNIDDSDYLVIDLKSSIKEILNSNKMPIDIKSKFYSAYTRLIDFEKIGDIGVINEISIKKDSTLGYYLLNNEDIEVVDEDYLISYDKVVNAMNIALYDDNPIWHKILPLFKSRACCSMRNELEGEYDSEVLDYILSNIDFKRHIEIMIGTYDSSHIVYRSNKYSLCYMFDDVKRKKLNKHLKERL